jgi:hypothetical protein
MMNCKVCERKGQWPSLKYYPAFARSDLGKPQKATVTVASVRAGIQTGQLQNTSQNHCRLTQLPCCLVLLYLFSYFSL